MIEIKNINLKKELCNEKNLVHILTDDIFEKSKLYLYDKNSYLFYENEKLEFLYFFLSGKARVLRNVENGKQALICFYKEFTVFGEVECIQKSEALSSVQIVEDAYILKVLLSDYEKLKKHIPFMNFLNEHLSKKLIKNNHNTIINMNYSVEQRLASYILFMNKDRYFQENHTYLAQYLGCSHRQLLRVINHFCEIHILQRNKDKFYVLNLELLSKIAGEAFQ